MMPNVAQFIGTVDGNLYSEDELVSREIEKEACVKLCSLFDMFGIERYFHC